MDEKRVFNHYNKCLEVIKQHTVAEGQVLKRTHKTVSGQQSQQLEE